MKFLAYKRYPFVGDLYIPEEDTASQAGLIVMVFKGTFSFDFTDDPDAPRQVIVSTEPFPTSARITNIKDRYGVQPLPDAEYTITSIEPIMTPQGVREAFRHQCALYQPPDFGFDVAR